MAAREGRTAALGLYRALLRALPDSYPSNPTARQFVEREVRQGFRQSIGVIDGAEQERLQERAREGLLLVRQSSQGRRRLRPPGPRRAHKRESTSEVGNAAFESERESPGASGSARPARTLGQNYDVKETATNVPSDANGGFESVKASESSERVTESAMSDNQETPTSTTPPMEGLSQLAKEKICREQEKEREEVIKCDMRPSSVSSFGALMRILSGERSEANVMADSSLPMSMENSVENVIKNANPNARDQESDSVIKERLSSENNASPASSSYSAHNSSQLDTVTAAPKSINNPADHQGNQSAGGGERRGLGAAAARGAVSAGRLYPSSRPVESEASQLNSAFVDGLRKTQR